MCGPRGELAALREIDAKRHELDELARRRAAEFPELRDCLLSAGFLDSRRASLDSLDAKLRRMEFEAVRASHPTDGRKCSEAMGAEVLANVQRFSGIGAVRALACAESTLQVVCVN